MKSLSLLRRLQRPRQLLSLDYATPARATTFRLCGELHDTDTVWVPVVLQLVNGDGLMQILG